VKTTILKNIDVKVGI